MKQMTIAEIQMLDAFQILPVVSNEFSATVDEFLGETITPETTHKFINRLKIRLWHSHELSQSDKSLLLEKGLYEFNLATNKIGQVNLKITRIKSRTPQLRYVLTKQTQNNIINFVNK